MPIGIPNDPKQARRRQQLSRERRQKPAQRQKPTAPLSAQDLLRPPLPLLIKLARTVDRYRDSLVQGGDPETAELRDPLVRAWLEAMRPLL